MNVAFDIEIADDLGPDCDDWRKLGSPGISCAATVTSSGELRLWHGTEQADGRLAGRMTAQDVRELLCYLDDLSVLDSAYVVTWNGTGFDWPILAAEAQGPEHVTACRMMACDHIDPAFQMLCEKGFMVGLQAAAVGMGLPGKSEGMHGDLAPAMWRQDRGAQEQVLEYVAQDARTTLDVYTAILKARGLAWTSKSGNACTWQPMMRVSLSGSGFRLLTVDECLALPLPDTSRMRNPWPRTKFCGWLEE